MTCKKCKSENLVMRPNAKNPTATELICADCGTWQKFISKEEIRVIEIHNKTKKTRITNADRIRGITDEELANELTRNPPIPCRICEYWDCKLSLCRAWTDDFTCTAAYAEALTLDWLKAETEGIT